MINLFVQKIFIPTGLFIAFLGNAQNNKEISLILTPQFGIDLSDSFAGTTQSGIRDFTNHYMIKLDAHKDWYGATIFYSIFKNSYLVSGHYEGDLLPTMVSGDIGGLGVFVNPIKLKRFELQLNLGLLYGGMDQLHWHTYTKHSNGQVTDIVYKKISSLGIGYYWGTCLNFPINNRIGFNMDIRLDDFDDNLTGLSTFFIASAGISIKIIP